MARVKSEGGVGWGVRGESRYVSIGSVVLDGTIKLIKDQTGKVL